MSIYRARLHNTSNGMVWYGMVYVNLYSAIVTNVSNALGTVVPGKQPSFQALFEGANVLLCAEVVRQRVPNLRAVNARRPTVESRCRGTTISCCVADRRRRILTTSVAGVQQSARCRIAESAEVLSAS